MNDQNDITPASPTDAPTDAPAQPPLSDAPKDVDADVETVADGEVETDAAEAEPSSDDGPAVGVEPGEANRIRALFTRTAGDDEVAGEFRIARWARPVVPHVFGVDGASADSVRAGVAEAAKRAGLEIADEDPDFGVNLLMFICESWGELKQAPGLDRLIPDLDKLIAVLGATGANQYRIFNFSPDEGIRLAVALIRYDADMERFSARALGLGQGVQTLLLWSDAAFASETPLTLNRRGDARLKPWFADLLAAAYGETAPVYSNDPAYAEQLAEGVAEHRAAAKSAAKARSGRRRSGAAAEAAESDPEAGSASEEPIDAGQDLSAREQAAEDHVDQDPAGEPPAGKAASDHPPADDASGAGDVDAEPSGDVAAAPTADGAEDEAAKA